MLPILLILFSVVFFIFFVLPCSILLVVEKQSDGLLYRANLRSWQNLLGVEWMKKGEKQFVQVNLIRRRILRSHLSCDSEKKIISDQSAQPKKKKRIKSKEKNHRPIIEDFEMYRKTNKKSVIKKYKRKELEELRDAHRYKHGDFPWFKMIERRLKELKSK